MRRAAALARQRQRTRRVPAPANREHRRVEQRLHEQVAHSFGIQITKNFVERKGMLRAERNDDGIVRRGGLQLEVERAAKTFAQREAPRAIDSIAERRMQHELHPAGFVEETFHHERLLRRNHTQRFINVRIIIGDLLGAACEIPLIV